MHKEDLEHIIRAASSLTNQYEIVVVRSQSILGSVDTPPAECLVSMEADIFVMNHESLSDLIDGSIGEGSTFHDSFGYYAQGVDSKTSVLAAGWKDRLVRLQTPNTNGVGYCLEITDLFLAKCAANREKDRDYNRALLKHKLVDPEMAFSRVESMPLSDIEKQRVVDRIVRLTLEAKAQASPISSSVAPGKP